MNIDVAWGLVEEYSKFPRWKPDDVNKSCKLITDKLEKFLKARQTIFLADTLKIYFDSETGISKRSFQNIATFGSLWPSSINNLKVAT